MSKRKSDKRATGDLATVDPATGEEEIHEQDDSRDDGSIGRAFWMSLGCIAALVCIGAAIYFALQQLGTEAVELSDNRIVHAEKRDVAEVKIPAVSFTDVTTAAGVTFTHVNGATRKTKLPKKLLPETMGGGAAFFDYDNDEDQDLFFVNSDYWPMERPADAENPTMALYQNDGAGNFTDVTVESNLDRICFGMGVAVGDYDGDGWRDLYVTAVGRNYLFRNDKGKFTDVTEQAGVAGGDDDWGTSCGWFDYDRDGLLDLYVCNYIAWSKEEDLKLGATLVGNKRAYAPPRTFVGAIPTLFHNDGDGKFSDVTKQAGLEVREPHQGLPEPKSLGLSFFDFDNDGWTDIFVANDTSRNMLFHNRQDGTFEEVGQSAGVAYDRSGSARGAMGIDTALFRQDDTVGVVIGNFANEPISLFVAQSGSSLFTDEAISTGIGPQTRQELTFGMFFFDYDLDGRLDVFTANGHLEEEIASVQRGQKYEQAPQLFWNAGEDQKTEFVAVPKQVVGESFCEPMVGRGATYADIDGDGDLDVVVSSTGRAPRLLRNDQQLEHNWLRVKLVGKGTNVDALGSTVIIETASGNQSRYVSPTCSYMSQRELPVTFGLGKTDAIDKLTVIWPDGTESFSDAVELNRLVIIEQESR